MALKLTSSTITDAQIAELQRVVKPYGVADIFCRIALGQPLPQKTSYGDRFNWNFDPRAPTERAIARARCADMLNARASEAADDEEPWSCDACGGELISLGTLGNREHFRCRRCGSEQSIGK